MRVTALEKTKTVDVFLQGWEIQYNIVGEFPLDDRADDWLLATTLTNLTSEKQSFAQGDIILRDEAGREYYQMGVDYGTGRVEGGVLKKYETIPVEPRARVQLTLVFVVLPDAGDLVLSFPKTPDIALRLD